MRVFSWIGTIMTMTSHVSELENKVTKRAVPDGHSAMPVVAIVNENVWHRWLSMSGAAGRSTDRRLAQCSSNEKAIE